MTGGDDARAMEAAQLHALRRRAEERRQELGETLAALTERLAADSHVSTWAKRGAQRATLGLGRATAAAVRRSLPLPSLDGSAALRRQAAGDGAAPGHGPAGGHARAAAAVLIPAAAAALAAWWWWRSTRQAGRRRRFLTAR